MADREKTTIDKAWEILFEKYNIVSNVSVLGSFQIKASQINEVKEARLMAKFDQSSQLPAIFKQNNFSILPISRGEYTIGNFNIYKKLEYKKTIPEKVDIPQLETLDHTNLYSEASALLFAYNNRSQKYRC